MKELRVKAVDSREMNEDIIRVHESRRKTPCGEEIKTGSVCRVSVLKDGTCRSTYAILRGHLDRQDANETDIFIDESLRGKLGIKKGEECSFSFEETDIFGYIDFALNASDPAYRISIQIAVVLGTVSLILGALSLIGSLFRW